MRPSFRLLFTPLLLLVTGCESLFYVEAETEEICKTHRNVSFPPVLPIPGTVQQTLLFPVGDITATIPTGDTNSELRVKLFELTATSGDPDLSGVETATMSLRLSEQSTPALLLQYRRPPNQPPTQSLSATGSGTLDLQELIRQENLELSFVISGQLPTRAWTADIRVCSGLWLRADFTDLLF